jgi:hypothetical protein
MQIGVGNLACVECTVFKHVRDAKSRSTKVSAGSKKSIEPIKVRVETIVENALKKAFLPICYP